MFGCSTSAAGGVLGEQDGGRIQAEAFAVRGHEVEDPETVITNWRCGATCQASELGGGVSSKLTTWAGINSESRDWPDSLGRSNLSAPTWTCGWPFSLLP